MNTYYYPAHNAHTFRYQPKPLTMVLRSNKCTKFDCMYVYFIIIHKGHKFTANINPYIYTFADIYVAWTLESIVGRA